jgi:hypothetical protein
MEADRGGKDGALAKTSLPAAPWLVAFAGRLLKSNTKDEFPPSAMTFSPPVQTCHCSTMAY